MRYAVIFLCLWVVASAFVWVLALVFSNSTDSARLLGSGFALAIGGVVGLAISDRRTRLS